MMGEVWKKYKHYKGNLYRVFALAKHSETMEGMVVYHALYGVGDILVRPAKMWWRDQKRRVKI